MTFNQCFEIRNLILVATVATSLGLGTDVIAQDHHSFLIDLNSRTVTNLGSLSSDDGANAISINDAGQVVEFSSGRNWGWGGTCLHHRP